jgi:NADH:ubiquinone oxidoreductase subunit
MLWMNGGVDRSRQAAYIGGMNIGTRLFTMLKGRRVGSDDAGNVYYEERRPRTGLRPRRWVAYAGAPEASEVPPEWHSWLHYTTSAPLTDAPRRAWQKPHESNRTGTPEGYRPPGHDYQGGVRAAATGDYEAWTPGA